MRRRLLLLAASLCVAPLGHGAESTTEILQRQTQEMMDAVASGGRDVWDRYLLPDMVYTAEDGQTKTKAQLLDEIQPLPKDIWGKLKVAEFKVVERFDSNAVIATYVAEEDEGYFGQTIHARYRSTDTWLRTKEGFKLLASQVLALRDDPPSIALPAARLDEYVGVYALTPEVKYTITREGDGLVGVRTGRKPDALKVETPDGFFVPGQPRLRKIFQRDANGRITGFVERRETWDVLWKRIG
jgi:hypothetical protein